MLIRGVRLLLTLVSRYVMCIDLSCVANGNYPRVARHEGPHVALLGVIAGFVLRACARDHRPGALVATSTST
jgi:hypothetical protein